MKKFKKVHQRIVSFVISMFFLFGLIPYSGSVFAENNLIDFEESGLELFTYSQDGDIKIKSSGGNKYMNISPITDGAYVFAEYGFLAGGSVPVEISYDFKINDYLNNNNIIADVLQDGDQFLEIKAKDNTLVYKKANGGYEKLIESLLVNKWYNLRLNMDFAGNIYTVYIDNVCVLKDQASLATYSYSDKNVKLVFSAMYAPGFAVDNFKAKDVFTTSSMNIDGESTVVIADGQAADFEYVVTAYDENGVEIPEFYLGYMIRPDYPGVSLAVDGKKIILSVSDTAAPGSFDLFATSGTNIASKKITIERYTPKTDSMKITGESRIAYGFFDNVYEYKVQMFDQLGAECDIDNIVFEILEDIPDTLSLDPNTGTITLTGELPKDVHITLRAELENNPLVSASKTLTLQDSGTYQKDNTRFETLIGHIDNVLKYGGTFENGSPLIAMAIDRLTLEPGVWYDYKDSDPYTPCEGASLASFLRAMDAVGWLSGEEKYNKRVEDIARFYIEEGSAPTGLPYWGGHTVIENETGKPNGGKGMVLEHKTHYPYLDPFFKLDPEWAERFCLSAYTTFILDWDTMMFTRHGSYEKEVNRETFNKNTENFVLSEDEYSPVYTYNLGFCYTLYDTQTMGVELIKRNNKDQNVINAYMKLYDSFWKATDKDTMINVGQNSTAGRYGHFDQAKEGILDISKYTPDGKWYLLDPLPEILTTTNYGDRFWNVMGEDLIAEGYVDADMEWIIRECYLRTETMSIENNHSYFQWPFVDAVGEDSPEGKIVIDRALRSTANYIDAAYNPSDNTFDYIFVDGVTNLSDNPTTPRKDPFVVKRNGYGTIGVPGYTFTPMGASAKDFAAATTNYMRGIKYPEYKRETDIMWSFIKSYAEHTNLGSFGTNTIGDEGMDVNLNTSEANPLLMMSILELYQATKKTEFLDLARVIADNIVENNMDQGMFVEYMNRRYIYTGSSSGHYPYAFAMLEATIRGEEDIMPDFQPNSSTREGPVYVVETGVQWGSSHDFQIYAEKMPNIGVVRIAAPSKEITMKVGEELKIDASVYPNDATDKSYAAASSDTKCVFVNEDTKVMKAMKPGTVQITLRSTSNPLVSTKFKVTVTE